MHPVLVKYKQETEWGSWVECFRGFCLLERNLGL